MAFDPQLQRQIMGRFATGVTVVTTSCDGQLWGMTANAVMSLSLSPPLVVVSVDKSASMHGLLQKAEGFAINILKREQEDLSVRLCPARPQRLCGSGDQSGPDRRADFGRRLGLYGLQASGHRRRGRPRHVHRRMPRRRGGRAARR